LCHGHAAQKASGIEQMSAMVAGVPVADGQFLIGVRADS